jgi:hypothetical protein
MKPVNYFTSSEYLAAVAARKAQLLAETAHMTPLQRFDDMTRRANISLAKAESELRAIRKARGFISTLFCL